MDPQIMQKAINSAREAMQHAAMHEQKGLPASASTILTIEMVKISAALKHFTGQPSRNSRILEDVLEKCRDRESNCRAAARRQMQTYGLLYKQGHFVKNWQTRLFILSGGQLKYYVPGDTEAKGTVFLHQIKSVQAVAVRQNGFKIETSGKIYMCQAPDEMSLQAWMAALRPLKVGFLMKQGQQGQQQWKKRWCMLWRTQLAFFESHTDNKDRKGYVLLRDVLVESVQAVDRATFGHENIFRVDTRERQFYMQAISAEDMEEWLSHIKTALQSRGAGSNMPAAGESTIGQAMAIADMESSETGGYESGGYTGEPEAVGPPVAAPAAGSYSPPVDAVNYALTMPPDANMSPAEVEQAATMQRELELQQRELAVQENALRLKEKELKLRHKELMLESREMALQEQLAVLASQGIQIDMPAPPPPVPVISMEMPAAAIEMAEPAPAPAPAGPTGDQQQFTFLVTSDDLFDDQRKCTVVAGSLPELEQEISQKIGLNVSLYVLIYDEDFDEYCLPDSLSDVPERGRIKVKTR